MKYTLVNDSLMIEVSSLYYRNVQAFLDALVPSRKLQHLIITNGWLRLDGIKVKRETPLTGDKLYLDLYPEKQNYPALKDKDVDIVYEDELLIVVNKKAQELVHSDGNEGISLTDRLRARYASRPYCINALHRLDRDTSGLLLFSKSMIFQPYFDKNMNEHEIRRSYLAFCAKEAAKGLKLSIDRPLGRDRHHAGRMIVYEKGQSAQTRAECLGTRKGVSVFRCTLLTGRTHQIRVHMAYEGYPVINDELYGKKIDDSGVMGLFAQQISLYHPLKEEILTLTAEVPEALRQYMP